MKRLPSLRRIATQKFARSNLEIGFFSIMIELLRPRKRMHPVLPPPDPKFIIRDDLGRRVVERAKHDLCFVIAKPRDTGTAGGAKTPLGNDLHLAGTFKR